MCLTPPAHRYTVEKNILLTIGRGCWTCRFRKKKCDETRPTCGQCRSLRIYCESAEQEQPLYMRDAEAAVIKKAEIKAQMGKCTRRRKKKSDLLATSQSDDRAERSVSRSSDETHTPESNDGDPLEEAKSLEYVPSPQRSTVLRIPTTRSLTLAPRASQVDSPTSTPDEEFSRTISSNVYVAPSSFLDSSFIAKVDLRHHQFQLLKHYIYNVCPSAYCGMSQSVLTELIGGTLIPRCMERKYFLYAALSTGAMHLTSVAKSNNQLPPTGLELEVAKYQSTALNGLKNEIARSTLPPPGMLAGILMLATYAVSNHVIIEPPWCS